MKQNKIDKIFKSIEALGSMTRRDTTEYGEKLSQDLVLNFSDRTQSVFNGIFIPTDLYVFLNYFSSGNIQSWQFCNIDDMFSNHNNLNNYLVSGLNFGGVDYLENVFLIATSSVRDVTHIAIDLNPHRFGFIGHYWYQGDLGWGGYPLVAKSFLEWLSKTIDYLPNSDRFYWEVPDFIDLGSAIPNDKSYRPIGSVIQ